MELKASDLRVGNWVNNNDEDYQITSTTIVQLERGDSAAKPIQLSDEWFVNLGFKQTEFAMREFEISYQDKIFKAINHYENGWLITLNWWHAGVMIEYVHQLQNLYHSLTLQEL